MNRLRNAALTLLSKDAAGLLIAAAVVALFWGVAQAVPGAPRTFLVALGVLLGAALALFALRHLWTLARARREHPAPGRLLDLGGYRVHLLAEGQVRDGRPPVLLFAGGHASGRAIHHLHRALREDTRSILIDRPGTGWSDTGPFPRSTAREAEEMIAAIEQSGERGPFVWAGHSFGGLLVANVARRRPDLVHTLVLLDPTPLETIVFGPRLSALRDMRRAAWLGGFAQLFGVNLLRRHEARQRLNPTYAKAIDATYAVLGAEAVAARALEANAGNSFVQASIYDELTPEGVAACAWDTVVYDRALGDLPLWLVAPRDDNDNDIGSLPEAQSGGETNARRMVAFFAATRERYLAASTGSLRIVAPKGSGHNFVYEHPQWTIDVLRAAVCGTPLPPLRSLIAAGTA